MSCSTIIVADQGERGFVYISFYSDWTIQRVLYVLDEKLAEVSADLYC